MFPFPYFPLYRLSFYSTYVTIKVLVTTDSLKSSPFEQNRNMLFSKTSSIYRLQFDRRCNIIQLFNTIQLSNLHVLLQRINLATDYSNTFSKELFPPLTKCIRLCAAITIVGSPFICKTAASGSFQQSTFSSTNGMLGSAALWYELTLLYQHLAKVLIGWIPF